ncbi:MAG: preprotein translocase subunit YajC [Betaproteobacteria bacterium]|nr:preprotein translocase subunit YajC [Betaproteobacteria bacterium]
MIISPAYAQAAGGDAASWTALLPIVLMFVLLYFMMIRPQMKRQKEHKLMVEALQKGDEVIAAGGLLGRITNVSDAYLTIEIAAGTEITVQKASAQVLLPKGTIKGL